MSFKVPGLSQSEGRAVFEPLPKAEYLLKVTAIETKDKDDNGVITGTTFIVDSIVENAENLPAGVDKSEVVGKSLRDWIFVMSPEHPKYNDVTKSGGTIGMIGVDGLKSFLMAVRVEIRADGFNEQACVGRFYEASVGTRNFKDKQGNDKVGNTVDVYRPAEEVGSTSVVDDADVPDDFEDDLE